jgi:iduronate 2-sulfatase
MIKTITKIPVSRATEENFMKRMKNINQIKNLSRQMLVPAGIALTLFARSEKQPALENLNVLFIAVDDLRPELNCYGNNKIISPNIDRLAQKGVLFERAYCQQAICMASRASIFTGIYPASNHLYSCLSVDSLMPGAVTINKHFANAGYEVLGIGKLYHYGEDHREQFGDTWLNNRTWVGDQNQGRGYITEESFAQLIDEGRGPAWENADVPDNAYRDGFYADRAIGMLGELKNSEKPFFLGVGFHKPHLPFNAPKKYWDLYDPDEIATAENPHYPENGSEYGWHNSSELRNYTNIPKDQKPLPIDMQKMLIHGYRACVSYVDAQVGRILDALEANGLSENTVVIFWGDHGWKLGEHGMWIKHTNFEIDTRVPVIIAAPGMKQNVKSTSFAEFVDVFPTLADLCGLEIPQQLHGRSLVPVLTDPAESVRDHAFSIWPSYRANRRDSEKAILGYSVRTNNYRYTEWIHAHSDELLDRELYNHINDPSENKNVISDEQYAEDLPALEALLQNYRDNYQN